ncbi:uncharacterized protein B0H64DRAFT_170279 [Chaetomium fimeti]|uniref:DUF7580 domain-containing protein n=1 Tax=Chaetomium fimeti TaxID=1854472 RepID=A0AAE0LT79_9PEZI|nr:hypothetical protein B0H64DRAFT_170279 [Chaetomium fimeti]
MSGFEVAGVVLGVLPLAIGAAKGYMGILSSMRDAKRNLKALVHDLETEQIRLETTCEVLLDGIVPPSAVDRMIRTPLGSEWKLYNDQLKLRLWTTSKKFEEQVTEMQKAVEELRAKLCMERDGSTKITDRVTIIRELKQNAAFSLKKKDYEDILNRIKTANSILHDLTGQNCGLGPSRKYRSQARLIGLIRGLARGIFNGLCSATSTCCCAKPHDVGLELEPRDAVIVPTDTDDEVGKKFDFHVAFGSKRAPENAGTALVTAWERIYARLADDIALAPTCKTATVPIAAPQKTTHGTGWAKSLSLRSAKNSLSFSADTQTLVEVSPSLAVAPVTPANTSSPYAHLKISELCQVIVRSPKAPAVDGYGVITNVERNFQLRPPENASSDSHTAITLREVLSAGKDTTLPPFEYPDKLRIALALVVSVLHLYKTPWLPTIVTLDDVLFLREGNAPQLSCIGYRPFVARNLKDGPEAAQAPRGPRPMNITVLSLGALLIQLIVGKVYDSLDMKGNMDMESILSKYEAASRFNGEVMTSGGINYASAVKWCLGTVLEVAGLEDDTFCQKFYGAVVAKLEDDAKLLTPA